MKCFVCIDASMSCLHLIIEGIVFEDEPVDILFLSCIDALMFCLHLIVERIVFEDEMSMFCLHCTSIFDVLVASLLF